MLIEKNVCITFMDIISRTLPEALIPASSEDGTVQENKKINVEYKINTNKRINKNINKL